MNAKRETPGESALNHPENPPQVAELMQVVGRQIASCQKVLLAYSGGLDSSVLLHLLSENARQRHDLRVRAAYVHHGLSADADGWAEHCQHRCLALQIPFSVLPVTVDGREKGIEAAARTARYQALAAHLLPNETLITAQHLDDQSETFLLALKRGSGPAGLSAMASGSSVAGHRLLRPLLQLSRSQLEQYARQHQLCWVEDESNQDDRFDRNFLRQHILPPLTRRWPHFTAAVARSAQLCAEQEQLLDELLAASLRAGCDAEGGLAIDGLLALSEPHRFALLRRWLTARGVLMPSREQLLHLWQDVALSRQDAEPLLQLGAVQIRRFRQRLYCVRTRQRLAGTHLTWRPDVETLTLPEGLGYLLLATQGTRIRKPRPDEQVSIGFGLHGKIHIVGRTGGRTVKKIWQEQGIAPWRREQIPIIYYNQQPIAAVGVFVTQEGDTEIEEDTWWVVWRESLSDS